MNQGSLQYNNFKFNKAMYSFVYGVMVVLL